MMATLKEDAIIIGAGLLVAYIAARYLVSKVGETAGKAVDYVADAAQAAAPYVNPASNQNVIYTGINGIGGAVSGEENWTLGGWLYDVTH